jgi:16S rRNA (uracil1498-N3)-methyltransferase
MEARLELPRDEAQHVFKVLRGREGDLIEVVDARGRLLLAELGGQQTAVVVVEPEAPAEEVGVALYQAVPKGGRMDLVVEKATEVGATAIVPLLTERGIVKPREGKVERWRRVAKAAARQSLRLRVPIVEEPVSFLEAARGAGEAGILMHNASRLKPVEAVVEEGARVFVGPEGGWSEEELKMAEEAGLALAQLGPYRLRSETAGIVAVARARAALESRVGA